MVPTLGWVKGLEEKHSGVNRGGSDSKCYREKGDEPLSGSAGAPRSIPAWYAAVVTSTLAQPRRARTWRAKFKYGCITIVE